MVLIACSVDLNAVGACKVCPSLLLILCVSYNLVEPALPSPPVTKSVDNTPPPAQQTKSVSHIPIYPEATSPADTPASPTGTASTTSQTKQAAIPKEQEDIDAETISKGYGLASGTRNTYAIPGMEEMSAEEYRDELQRSISARQVCVVVVFVMCDVIRFCVMGCNGGGWLRGKCFCMWCKVTGGIVCGMGVSFLK